MRMIISRSRTPLTSSKTCGAFADLRMVGRRRQLAPEDAECPWRQLRGASRSPRSGPPPLATGQARAVARLAEALRAKAATLKQELHAEPRLARALIIAGHQEARIQTERPVRERRGVDERLHVHLPRIERRLVDVEARASPAHVVVLVRHGALIEQIQDVGVDL